jgi:hypothetical protein
MGGISPIITSTPHIGLSILILYDGGLFNRYDLPCGTYLYHWRCRHGANAPEPKANQEEHEYHRGLRWRNVFHRAIGTIRLSIASVAIMATTFKEIHPFLGLDIFSFWNIPTPNTPKPNDLFQVHSLIPRSTAGLESSAASTHHVIQYLQSMPL